MFVMFLARNERVRHSEGMTSTTAPTGAPAAGSTMSTKAIWLTLIVILIADALDLIDATITNVAAPSIVRDIGGGEALVKWLGASYALALGSLLVLGGRIGDRFGQRRTFLIGMTGFVAASALAGLAPGPAVLVTARLIQGAFGALLIPQGMAIMTRTFPRETLTKAFGAFGPMLAIFGVGGPILAGFLIDANLFGLGWRPVFLINVLVGGLGLLLAVKTLPHVAPDPTTRIDWTAAALLSGTMLTLLYGLIEGSSAGWTIVPVSCIAAALVLFTAFTHRQRTSASPLIKPSLLRNRGFASGLVLGLLVFAAFNGLTYVISLFFQYGLHYTPTHTSLSLLPLTIGIIIGSGTCMALIAKLGRVLVLAGLLVTALGAGLFLAAVNHYGLHTNGWLLASITLVIGIGAGICFGSIFDTALGDIDHDEAGAASGSLSAVQQLAAGVGSAVVTTVYFHTLGGGQAHAMITSLVTVLGLCLLCLAAVPLLPKRAADLEHH
ncbi:MFS transporter [Micromonospora sp. HUAS LYJ1]|uniref:MFS transporter n=1 Tax=Micromonospora sp. HUAS LYJ1 TaxID=3061626 RepID=UPI0026732B3B|nr:MFS transporter [Micromonospora sp. HUAS LYJ1]WKU03998.1 MFS transporter [Micromonospora sp. HUAS LYJ1]